MAFSAVSLSAIALVGLSSAAQADDSRCPTNRFCLFEHDNYGGGRAVFSGTDTNLTNNNWAGTTRSVHDGASSMINNTSRRVALFANVSCTGASYNAGPESKDSDLTYNSSGVNFDNKADCVVFI
jgi:hypothetical protein